jgi:hypothetical protein
MPYSNITMWWSFAQLVFMGCIHWFDFFPHPWPRNFFFFCCEIPRSFQNLHFFIVVVTFINFERITYFVGKICVLFFQSSFFNLGEKQFKSLCLILKNVWERICKEFHIVGLKLCAFLCVFGNLVKSYDFCSQNFPPQ